ncbi:MAG: hypothetical protein JSV26_11235 [bacterium]|nr:MAG: hypothetical protein JSV26_11235 [bacterium]
MRSYRECKGAWRYRVSALAAGGFLLSILAGCGSGPGSMGVSSPDEAAIAAALESDSFFTFHLTGTDEDQESRAAAAAQAAVSAPSAGAIGGTAELPVFWWRGGVDCLQKDYDISVVDNTATVTVTHFAAGGFHVARDIGRVLVLWGVPLADTAVRHAEFVKKPWGWKLTAISPVDISLTDDPRQSVWISRIRVYSGGELVWSTDSPSSLYSVPEGIPTFLSGEEVLVEADIVRTDDSVWTPAEFVFLHRPAHTILGGMTRDLMFDDGTNGDAVAGDGTYSRTYTIGPHAGRHFAVVDVIDAAAFMEQDAPYNSGAWGMPYIVE